MGVDSAPEKVTLVNMVTGDSRTAQYNPEQLQEQFGVSYADLAVPGLSHKRTHFVNTENVSYTFDLRYRAIGENKAGFDAIQEDRKWLQSLTHPWRSASIERGGPPEVMFIWPELVSLVCRVKSIAFTYTQFRRSGGCIAFTASAVLEEVRVQFVGMEEIAIDGMQRASTKHSTGEQ